jgi:hypothetical protein
MPDTTPYIELQAAIQRLENEQAVTRQLLHEQFKVTIERLNPFSFLKNSALSIAGSPEVRNNLLTILVPLAAGFISKRAGVGNRLPVMLKRAGIILLDGLNRYVSQNPEVVITISHFVLNFFRRKKTSEEKEV